MRKPRELHIDPLQRWIEIDGRRFACTEEDARRFESLLNEEYSLQIKRAGEGIIEIKENPASATGLDIHFTTFHGGVRTEVKGHLTQEHLDLLQNEQKCDLLQHGIVLRLSPPNLLIRRRRPDGGEERIPEIPDVKYRHTSAAELQAILNDSRLRRTGEGAGATAPVAEPHPAEIREIRVVRNPENRLALWLECVAAHGDQVEGMALTHHNVAELQQRGVFRPELDVVTSLDAHELSVLNQTTHEEKRITLAPESSDDELSAAGQLLSEALKAPSELPAPSPTPPEPIREEPQPSSQTQTAEEAQPATASPPSEPPAAPLPEASGEQAAPPSAPMIPEEDAVQKAGASRAESLSVSDEKPGEQGPTEEPTDENLFPDQEARHVIEGTFSALTRHVDAPVQEAYLSLPRVFSGRRFVVLSFNGQRIGDLGELRSEAFYGFYLSFVDADTVILVFACEGRHVEWGTEKCVVQPSLSAEAEEFTGAGLLGLAQDEEGNFLFVVTPAYRQWIQTREQDYRPVFARFLTAGEFAARTPRPTVIWPE
jgi:hypothetical protein